MALKVLNLYCGIGGNRRLRDDCDVTAVELDENIAKIYQTQFPNDTVIVCDAHEYLLNHFREFDFIWSSRAGRIEKDITTQDKHQLGIYLGVAIAYLLSNLLLLRVGVF